MSRRPPSAALATVVLMLLLAGCSSAPTEHPPGTTPANQEPPAGGVTPRVNTLPPAGENGYTRIVAGAGDSTSALPGSPGAEYRFRFRMLQPSGSGGTGFNFQDRDLSFYFRVSPASIYFQIENRQNRPVTIDWEQSQWLAPNGQYGKLAHSTTRWDQRFSYQPSTTINGLQRYGDYVFGMNSLVDPAGSMEQLHRAMLPEDQQAMQFTDRVFGMDLVILVENQPRTYTVRFKVDSVTPNN